MTIFMFKKIRAGKDLAHLNHHSNELDGWSEKASKGMQKQMCLDNTLHFQVHIADKQKQFFERLRCDRRTTAAQTPAEKANEKGNNSSSTDLLALMANPLQLIAGHSQRKASEPCRRTDPETSTRVRQPPKPIISQAPAQPAQTQAPAAKVAETRTGHLPPPPLSVWQHDFASEPLWQDDRPASAANSPSRFDLLGNRPPQEEAPPTLAFDQDSPPSPPTLPPPPTPRTGVLLSRSRPNTPQPLSRAIDRFQLAHRTRTVEPTQKFAPLARADTMSRKRTLSQDESSWALSPPSPTPKFLETPRLNSKFDLLAKPAVSVPPESDIISSSSTTHSATALHAPDSQHNSSVDTNCGCRRLSAFLPRPAEAHPIFCPWTDSLPPTTFTATIPNDQAQRTSGGSARSPVKPPSSDFGGDD
ncbi:hypothetical protein PAPYR_4150 [Paratrimastix pyriformis]|uniref:Uncharacterized protein n=1 Tax=Paratrimastix pyriformis TaxID=342808 RepID=A0ABQ8UMQ8_9EUKA|nr:hypothetical protein PAPYR_4150 [Paratrimastix pyriformis]